MTTDRILDPLRALVREEIAALIFLGVGLCMIVGGAWLFVPGLCIAGLVLIGIAAVVAVLLVLWFVARLIRRLSAKQRHAPITGG